MYHAIVRRKIRQAFADINAGRYDKIISAFAPQHRHTFYGVHAIGGVRTDPADTKKWYERLPRLVPDLKFDVHYILVQGMPWNTVVMAEWTDHFKVGDKPMQNNGVHRFVLKWGKVTDLAIHCDTQRVAEVMMTKELQGNAEAGAPIIGSPAP
jgi:ketosteroid isomerase-like protein